MKTLKHTLMAVIAATIGLCASFAAYAQTRVYATDQRNEVVKNSSGLCWRTGYWTPAAAAQDPAGCECDKDIIPRDVCEKTPRDSRPVVSGGKVTLSADALFDFNKSDLRPEGRASLDNIVAKSKDLVLEVVIAVGHADRIGNTATNQKLSERRAASVKAYLLKKGVPANRIYTEGKGSQQPVTRADECTGAKSAKVIACLQPDRRVDIEIIGTKK
ncbi:MAG: OmpA family protein [Candidatus Accumulibacter sp.]|jgi:OOP family OmpA-OmpF porin|nr:OmpA family protein [Accumulibacter sp.]